MITDCQKYYNKLANKLEKKPMESIDCLQIHDEATALYNTLDNCLKNEVELSTHYKTQVLTHKQREEMYTLQKKLIDLEMIYGKKTVVRYKKAERNHEEKKQI